VPKTKAEEAAGSSRSAVVVATSSFLLVVVDAPDERFQARDPRVLFSLECAVRGTLEVKTPSKRLKKKIRKQKYESSYHDDEPVDAHAV
jgi:hypothetical protein